MTYGELTNPQLYGHGTNSNYQVRLGYEVVSEDVSTNKRQVKLQLEVRSINSVYQTYGFSQTTTIDGVNLSPAIFDMRPSNEWKIFGSRTIEITGAYTGTKTASFTTNANIEWTLKSGSASVSIELPSLHKAPDLTYVGITENYNKIGTNNLIVTNISNKTFTVNYTLYDSATASQLKIYTRSGSEITMFKTTSLGASQGTLTLSYIYDITQNDVVNGKTYFTLELIDSKGGKSQVTTPEYNVIFYNGTNIETTSSKVKRAGQTTGEASLTLTGSWYNGTIGVTTNTLTMKFRYWKVGDTESTTYITIPSNANTGSGNTIEISNWKLQNNGTDITAFDKEYRYYIEITIEDALTRGQVSIVRFTLSRGVWIMAKYKDRVGFLEITTKNKYLSNIGDTIKVCKDTPQSVSANTTAIVTLNTVEFNNSNKLTLSNNAIYIGKNVHTVLVNVRWTSWGADSTERYIYIFKNDTNVAFNMRSYSATMETTAIIPVEEGDYIDMRAYHTQSSSISINNDIAQTFLEVTILN